mgnify:CR=1 FL=1
MDSFDELRNIRADETLTVKISRKKQDRLPPFLFIGSGMTTKIYDKSVVLDVIDIFSKLSKQQIEIIHYFKKLLVEDNLYYFYNKKPNPNPNRIILPSSKFNTEAVSVREKLKSNGNSKKLVEMGIIKKVKQGEYMISPYFIIPSDNIQEALQQWNKLS